VTPSIARIIGIRLSPQGVLNRCWAWFMMSSCVGARQHHAQHGCN
jgi:hypothetical protein